VRTDVVSVVILVFECVDSSVVIVQQRAPLIKVFCYHYKFALQILVGLNYVKNLVCAKSQSVSRSVQLAVKSLITETNLNVIY